MHLALVANPKAVSSAWMTIAEYGVVGAILVVILGAFLFFIHLMFKGFAKRFDENREDENAKTERTNKIMGEKDDKLEKANVNCQKRLDEARREMQEVATNSVAGLTISNERTNVVLGLLEDVLEILRNNQSGGQQDGDASSS